MTRWAWPPPGSTPARTGRHYDRGWTEQRNRAARVFRYMQSDLWGHRSAAEAAEAERTDLAAAEAGVTALYQAHALGLIRLAHIMLGDRQNAEDVVQEAFCGLYRRWSHLSDTSRALQYLRTSVLNGCRSLQRRRAGPRAEPSDGQPAVSAEATVITGEERREVMRAPRSSGLLRRV